MRIDKNLNAFLALLRAGLWESNAQLLYFGEPDLNIIYRLSQEQSVVGLVAAGLEHVIDVKFPKDITLLFVGEALRLEQKNSSMNDFIAGLVHNMRDAGIYVLLIKGQGIAQCYDRPLWRASGDVDLLLSKSNYSKAKEYLSSLSVQFEDECKETMHLAFSINPWVVELHGTFYSGLWRRIDQGIESLQNAVIYDGNVRSWMDNGTKVFLPGVNEDVIFIFTHILQHFFKGGIGLRQICDWCRLLWTYRKEIDRKLLKERLSQMGIMSEWKAFSALAVDYLGMPPNDMPYYSPKGCWSRKAGRILSYIIDTGNFGHNRDISYQSKYPPVIRKVVTFWRQAVDSFRLMGIFPLDALRSLFNYGIRGTKTAFK